MGHLRPGNAEDSLLKNEKNIPETIRSSLQFNGRPPDRSATPPNRKMDRAFQIPNRQVDGPIPFRESQTEGLTVQENIQYLEMLQREHEARNNKS